MDFNGYTGNILNVDLTNNKISLSKEHIEDLKKFIGGSGMNTKLGAERLSPNTDPLSTENIIILGAGPLVGTITPGASRSVGFSKFPATGAIANSCGSMNFGFNLKLAGYDHVIISGKSEKPVFLLIWDDHIEICDAKDLWGKDIVETTNTFWKKYNSCGVIAIGQAGENLVFGALALIDKTTTFGRGGLGAVMGSKNLKAVVSKGTKGISIAYPKEFNNLYKKQIERVRNYIHRDSWIELGMLRSTPLSMGLAAAGYTKKAREATPRTYLKKLKKRRIACPSCPMADKDILEIREGEFSGCISYVTSIISPFGMLSIDGIDTCNQAVKIHDMINRYGLDYITMSSYFQFLSNMYQRGIISKEDIGFEWRNDYETIQHVIEITANREGFGNILADGWRRLAEINDTIANEMNTVKGLGQFYDPRLTRLGTMEFEQVVNIKGAHVASGGSPTYMGADGAIENFRIHFKRMGIPESATNRLFSPPKKEMAVNVGRLTRYSEDWYTLLTNLGLCARAQMNRFWGIETTTAFYNAVTGFDISFEDMRKAAERTWNLLKLMNVKEGFSRKDDQFPKEWFKPLKLGASLVEMKDFTGTTKITPEIANLLIDDYYDERGWNKMDGFPTPEKIKELGLEKFV
jgi:aldehyde:ferredoxin oxidoreductase